MFRNFFKGSSNNPLIWLIIILALFLIQSYCCRRGGSGVFGIAGFLNKAKDKKCKVLYSRTLGKNENSLEANAENSDNAKVLFSRALGVNKRYN